jgi:hypothetical protein
MRNKAKLLTFENWTKSLQDFHRPLRPYPHASLEVHWSDCSKVIRALQSEIKSGGHLTKCISELDTRLMGLNQKTLWIKNKETIFPMSIYDVYLTLMAHLKKGDFEDVLFDGHEISFISPSGPYKNSTVVELVSRRTFQDFVHYHVLKNKLHHRGFRLHTRGNVKMLYGADLENSTLLEIKQITDNGVLFSSRDEVLLDSVTHGEQVKVLIDTSKVCELLDGKDVTNHQDLFFTNNELRYFNVHTKDIISSLSYDSALTGEFYLFIRYWHMQESELPSVFNDFINYSKDKLFAA